MCVSTYHNNTDKHMEEYESKKITLCIEAKY